MKKPTRDQMLARIVSDNDRDRAECDQWMREASTHEKLQLWAMIQQRYKCPTMECMSRFAQLAFAESAERVMGKEPKR